MLDRRENGYSKTYEALVAQFRELVERHLELLHMNQELARKNQELQTYLDEINTLRGIVPMCAFCKRIQDKSGAWHPVEHYLYHHPEADFSHTYCPECFEQHFGGLLDDATQAADAS